MEDQRPLVQQARRFYATWYVDFLSKAVRCCDSGRYLCCTVFEKVGKSRKRGKQGRAGGAAMFMLSASDRGKLREVCDVHPELFKFSPESQTSSAASHHSQNPSSDLPRFRSL